MPLDELYFRWLYSQVADPDIEAPSRSYWKLLRILYTKEFTWIIPNDDNRLEDGKALRREFIQDQHIQDVDQNWIELGCSMLELTLGLARRLSFEADGETHYWFWHLMGNLGLQKYNDGKRFSKRFIDAALDTVIWRTYTRSGEGGFFPLKNPDKDQRKVELWYQLSSYVIERE